MNRFILIFLALFSIVLFSNAHAEGLGKGFRFSGLWLGVDRTDGSEALRTIVDDHNGEFTIIGTESYFTACQGDRGYIQGTGQLSEGIFSPHFSSAEKMVGFKQ